MATTLGLESRLVFMTTIIGIILTASTGMIISITTTTILFSFTM